MASKKKAPAHPTIPNGFDVAPDADTQHDFPAQRHLTIVLNAAHQAYEVYQKAIPAHLKGSKRGGKDIHWMNNFGLQEKGKSDFAIVVPKYEIVLDRIDNAEYFVFDGEILPLQTTPDPNDPSKVRATLHLGDPAVGWGG